MQKSIENIIKEVADQYKVPYEVAKAVFEAQNMHTRLCMSKGEHGQIDTFLNIRWRNFGSFIVKPYRLAKIHANGLIYKSKQDIKNQS